MVDDQNLTVLQAEFLGYHDRANDKTPLIQSGEGIQNTVPPTLANLTMVQSKSKKRYNHGNESRGMDFGIMFLSVIYGLLNIALASGQRWGIVHLYGQKRLGEITSKIDPVRPITGGFGGGSKKSITPTKHQQLSVVGVPARTASDAERIAAHPEIMENLR